jgi:hypothetical protein
MEIAGFITGVIALIISGFVAWKNYLSPFNVKIYCGNPRLERMPQQLEDGGTVIRFSAILPLYFTNTGARDGAISDIALIVKSEKNTWLFQPFFYTKYSIKTESTLGETLTKDPSNEPFYPVHLAGKSTVYKSIVFALVKHEKFPFGTNPLLPGRYTFQVQTSDALKKDYETKLIFNVNLNEEYISSLSAGLYIIPFVEEVIKRRQSLQVE